MFLVFYQYHSNARTRMYGQDAFEPGWRICIGCGRSRWCKKKHL